MVPRIWLKAWLDSLGVLRKRKLLRLVGLPEASAEPIEAGPFLVLAVAMRLRTSRILRDDQQELLLEELHTHLAEIGRRIHGVVSVAGVSPASRALLPVAQLCLLDGVLVRLSGQERCLDLRSGDWHDSLPYQPVVEIIAWDLTALYLRTRAQLERNHASPAATSSPVA